MVPVKFDTSMREKIFLTREINIADINDICGQIYILYIRIVRDQYLRESIQSSLYFTSCESLDVTFPSSHISLINDKNLAAGFKQLYTRDHVHNEYCEIDVAGLYIHFRDSEFIVSVKDCCYGCSKVPHINRNILLNYNEVFELLLRIADIITVHQCVNSGEELLLFFAPHCRKKYLNTV